jgi:hypothetical protein
MLLELFWHRMSAAMTRRFSETHQLRMTLCFAVFSLTTKFIHVTFSSSSLLLKNNMCCPLMTFNVTVSIKLTEKITMWNLPTIGLEGSHSQQKMSRTTIIETFEEHGNTETLQPQQYSSTVCTLTV